MIPTIHEVIARNTMPIASQKLGLVSAKYRREVININKIIQGISINQSKNFQYPVIMKKRSLIDKGKLAAIINMIHII